MLKTKINDEKNHIFLLISKVYKHAF